MHAYNFANILHFCEITKFRAMVCRSRVGARGETHRFSASRMAAAGRSSWEMRGYFIPAVAAYSSMVLSKALIIEFFT